MTLRELQEPIKAQYRDDPDAARITLRATGSTTGTGTDSAMSCSIDLGRAIYAAGAHPGVGGSGSAACSGDLLLGALAACAQLTCQMVAANMGLEGVKVSVTVEGDLDLRGTLGTADVPVGLRGDPCRVRPVGRRPGRSASRSSRSEPSATASFSRRCLRHPTSKPAGRSASQ